MSRSHDKYEEISYAINEEMASDYTEVLVNLCRSCTRGILRTLTKDYAPERKESFYAKIKVSTFVNFEVDRLKMMMKTAVLEFNTLLLLLL